MKIFLMVLGLLFLSGCTPYTAEEYAELTAKEEKWNGPKGNVCVSTSHGQLCNYSGR